MNDVLLKRFLFLLSFSRSDGSSSTDGSTVRSDSPAPSAPVPPQEEAERAPDPELEKRLLGYLSDLSLSLPMDSLAITNELNTVRPELKAKSEKEKIKITI